MRNAKGEKRGAWGIHPRNQGRSNRRAMLSWLQKTEDLCGMPLLGQRKRRNTAMAGYRKEGGLSLKINFRQKETSVFDRV